MKKKGLIAFIIVSILIVGAVWYRLYQQNQTPVIVSRTDPPKISSDSQVHELGQVTEGSEVPYVVKIQNMGGEPLIIQKVQTSCCSVINLKTKYIEPGKAGELEVVFDTKGKKGHTQKSIKIFSNDPDQPKYTLYIAANVIPQPEEKPQATEKPKPKAPTVQEKPQQVLTVVDPHAGMTDEKRRKIFIGNCGTCHAQMGRGKMGAELFQADCAMCHGNQAQGGIGPALVPGNYSDPAYLNHINRVIRFGSDTSESMPGFITDIGGPLTEGEVQSIVQYLQSQSENQLSPQPYSSSPNSSN